MSDTPDMPEGFGELLKVMSEQVPTPRVDAQMESPHEITVPIELARALERECADLKHLCASWRYAVEFYPHDVGYRAGKLLNGTSDGKEIVSELIRLRDLVRYQRAELHQADLITDDEYAELCSDPNAVARLQSYDDVRAEMKKLQSENAALADENRILKAADYEALTGGADYAALKMERDETIKAYQEVKDWAHRLEANLTTLISRCDEVADGSTDATEMGKFANELIGLSNDLSLGNVHSVVSERDKLKKTHEQVVELCESYQNACIEGCEPESILADADRRINLICKTSCEALAQLNEARCKYCGREECECCEADVSAEMGAKG